MTQAMAIMAPDLTLQPITISSPGGIPGNKHDNPPTEEDWRKIKRIFTRLYVDDRRMLKDVVSELEQKHDFHATANMCKKRIKAWGLDRNLKQHEVEHILGILRQRRSQRKDTVFFLRGKRVDIHEIHRYVRRKGTSISQLEERFMTGQSKGCPGLEVFSLQSVQPCSAPPALQDSLEHLLREAKNLQLGLLEAGLCSAGEYGISYPSTEVGQDIRDLAHALYGETSPDGYLTLIRRLALLLERAVEVYNIYDLLKIVEMMMFIARAGYDTMTQSILDHLQRLINIKLSNPRPQFRFYQQMVKLHPAQLSDALIALYDLLVDMHVELRPGDVKFQLCSRNVHTLMRYRLDLLVESSSVTKLLRQNLQLFGPLEAYCFLVAFAVLGFQPEALELSAGQEILDYLAPEHLKYESPWSGLMFRGKRLTFVQALCIGNLYMLAGARQETAWVLKKLLESRILYKLTLGEEYKLLGEFEDLADVATPEKIRACTERKREIEDIWLAELEAAIPDDDLVTACNVVNRSP